MSKFVHIKRQISTVSAPASKSFAQRAIFASALSHSKSVLVNCGNSDDVLNIVNIINQIGYDIRSENNELLITPKNININQVLNIGESGLGTRLSVPILSHLIPNFKLTGNGTILNRPMGWFTKYLPQTGLNIELTNNHLPATVNGKLKGGNYEVDGSLSSQYISGLLMALPLCEQDSILTVKNPVSTPYIDITLSVLKTYNIRIEHEHYSTYKINGNQNYKLNNNTLTIEGDYSGAVFWIVYGLSNQGISITNLNSNSVQADVAILEVVKQVGGTYNWTNNILEIIPPETLIPFEFDATHCPDLFPILTVLAAGINGKSVIKGTERLTFKESDRTMVLIKEFSKLGLNIAEKNNHLIIKGKGVLNSGQIHSNNDHRIAMAFAIASVLTPHGLYITNPDCVSKSYPDFWDIVG